MMYLTEAYNITFVCVKIIYEEAKLEIKFEISYN